MFEFLIRVKRVSHVNRVSSNHKPAKYPGMFLAAAILIFLGANCVFASDITPQKVIDLANADRKDKGISELAENEKLSQAASDKAEDMVLKNYFAHTSPKGITPWRWIEKENYGYNYAGENLAMDFTSAEKMNEAWLASPTHRANILNEKYKEIGIAVREGVINGHTTTIVVQIFGSGDKNVANRETVQKEKASQPAKDTGSEDFYPQLPLDENKDGQARLTVMRPVVTSPSANKIVSGKRMEIFGRATPLTQVTIFDEEKEIGTANAGDSGWFRLNATGFSVGEHSLSAKSESVGKRKTGREMFSQRVTFKVDKEKPLIRYQLYAEGDRGDEYLLKIVASEKDCRVVTRRENLFLNKEKSTVITIPKNWLSGMMRVEDNAGNKTFQEINFSSLYKSNGENSLLKEIAEILVSERALAQEADDSGRRILAQNLGLVIGGNK